MILSVGLRFVTFFIVASLYGAYECNRNYGALLMIDIFKKNNKIHSIAICPNEIASVGPNGHLAKRCKFITMIIKINSLSIALCHQWFSLGKHWRGLDLCAFSIDETIFYFKKLFHSSLATTTATTTTTIKCDYKKKRKIANFFLRSPSCRKHEQQKRVNEWV